MKKALLAKAGLFVFSKPNATLLYINRYTAGGPAISDSAILVALFMRNFTKSLK